MRRMFFAAGMIAMFAMMFWTAALQAQESVNPVCAAVETPCNGGTCDAGGSAISCPASGGPSCKSDESCECKCKKEGKKWTTYNNCKKTTSAAQFIEEGE